MNGMARRASRLSDVSQPDTPPAGRPARRSLPAGTQTPATPPAEGAEKVKVVVRMRPPHAHETAGGVSADEDGRTIVLQRSRNESVAQTDFKFDKVLAPGASQADVYEAAVRPIVEDVLRGFNGTIMAYGQTGAGKTYTLSSVQSAENIGMMPRAAAHLFSEIAADSGHVWNVLMGYVQIYQELIQDLLRPESVGLQIREGPSGVFVSGVEERPVRSVEDCLRLMQLGDQNRRVAFTQLNATSSRSHAIIMLTLIKRRRQPEAPAPERPRMQVGKLFIVDLAGSERLKKSQSTGQRASEAKAINLSLTTLGICINARAEAARHVPFRDSKLTRLLQESLGGNAKTSLVVAVAHAEEHADESLQALQFGTRAMRVTTRAVVNESTAETLLSADVLASLGQLEAQPCLVDASLLAKEEQLERAQEELQAEKDSAAKIIAALRAERDTRQADREAELSAARAKAEAAASQQAVEQRAAEQAAAAAAAEVASLAAAHQQEQAALAQQLTGAEAAAEQLRQQAATAAAVAQTEAAAAGARHAQEMERAGAAAAQQLAAMAMQLAAAEQQHASALAQAQAEAAAAQGRADAAREELALQKLALQEEWQARLLELEQAGQQQLAQAQAAAAARQTEALAQAERVAAGAADAAAQLESLQRAHATLENEHSALAAAAAASEARAAALEGQLAAATGQLAGFERGGELHRQLWAHNFRHTNAARIIQRSFRARRQQRLAAASSQAAWALAAESKGRTAAEGRAAALAADGHRHLVWAGQSLVAGSLAQLQEAVGQIRAAYLLPAKELRALGNVKSRMSLSPGLGGSPAGTRSPGLLARSPSLASEASIGSFVGRPPTGAAKTPLAQRALGGISAHWGSPAL